MGQKESRPLPEGARPEPQRVGEAAGSAPQDVSTEPAELEPIAENSPAKPTGAAHPSETPNPEGEATAIASSSRAQESPDVASPSKETENFETARTPGGAVASPQDRSDATAEPSTEAAATGSGLQATPKVTQTEAETVGEDLPTTSPSKKALASEGPAASETLASDPHQGDTGSISQALPAKAQAADVKFGSEPESATPELTPGAHGTEGTVTEEAGGPSLTSKEPELNSGKPSDPTPVVQPASTKAKAADDKVQGAGCFPCFSPSRKSKKKSKKGATKGPPEQAATAAAQESTTAEQAADVPEAEALSGVPAEEARREAELPTEEAAAAHPLPAEGDRSLADATALHAAPLPSPIAVSHLSAEEARLPETLLKAREEEAAASHVPHTEPRSGLDVQQTISEEAPVTAGTTDSGQAGKAPQVDEETAPISTTTPAPGAGLAGELPAEHPEPAEGVRPVETSEGNYATEALELPGEPHVQVEDPAEKQASQSGTMTPLSQVQHTHEAIDGTVDVPHDKGYTSSRALHEPKSSADYNDALVAPTSAELTQKTTSETGRGGPIHPPAAEEAEEVPTETKATRELAADEPVATGEVAAKEPLPEPSAEGVDAAQPASAEAGAEAEPSSTTTGAATEGALAAGAAAGAATATAAKKDRATLAAEKKAVKEAEKQKAKEAKAIEKRKIEEEREKKRKQKAASRRASRKGGWFGWFGGTPTTPAAPTPSAGTDGAPTAQPVAADTAGAGTSPAVIAGAAAGGAAGGAALGGVAGAAAGSAAHDGATEEPTKEAVSDEAVGFETPFASPRADSSAEIQAPTTPTASEGLIGSEPQTPAASPAAKPPKRTKSGKVDYSAIHMAKTPSAVLRQNYNPSTGLYDSPIAQRVPPGSYSPMRSSSSKLQSSVSLARQASLQRKASMDRTPLTDTSSRKSVPDELKARMGQGIDRPEVSKNLRPLTTALG